MTVSELKAALGGLPEHHRVIVHVEMVMDADCDFRELDEYVDAIDIVAGKDPLSYENAVIIQM